MIQNRVYRLKQDVEIGKDMPLKKGQEIEIVMDVVYINGVLIPPVFQALFLNWVKNNPKLIVDVTLDWGRGR